MASTVVIHGRVRIPKCRDNRPLRMVVVTKVGRATATAVRSMLVRGASQKPRKITLPVMFATNTWPRTKILSESARPVANVSNNNAATVDRSDTGDVSGHGCSIFRRPEFVRVTREASDPAR